MRDANICNQQWIFSGAHSAARTCASTEYTQFGSGILQWHFAAFIFGKWHTIISHPWQCSWCSMPSIQNHSILKWSTTHLTLYLININNKILYVALWIKYTQFSIQHSIKYEQIFGIYDALSHHDKHRTHTQSGTNYSFIIKCGRNQRFWRNEPHQQQIY